MLCDQPILVTRVGTLYLSRGLAWSSGYGVGFVITKYLIPFTALLASDLDKALSCDPTWVSSHTTLSNQSLLCTFNAILWYILRNVGYVRWNVCTFITAVQFNYEACSRISSTEQPALASDWKSSIYMFYVTLTLHASRISQSKYALCTRFLISKWRYDVLEVWLVHMKPERWRHLAEIWEDSFTDYCVWYLTWSLTNINGRFSIIFFPKFS
jgi:hypothetical protein